MATDSTKRWQVVGTDGVQRDVQAERVELSGTHLKFYDGEDLVAGFTSYNSFTLVPEVGDN